MIKKIPVWISAVAILLFIGSCSGKKSEGAGARNPVADPQGQAQARTLPDEIKPGDPGSEPTESVPASGDWEEAFKFVRDAIRTEPSRFALKTAQGIEWSRSANPLEKALYLARLLQEKGRTVEIAEGELDDAAARGLLGAIFPPAKPVSYGNDVPISVPAEDTALISAVKRHFWVRMEEGEDRVDLDPSMPAAEPGKAFASVARTYEPTDEALAARVSLAVEYIQGASGGPQSVLSWDGPITDIANRPLSLSVMTEYTQVAPEAKGEVEEKEGESGGLGGLFGGVGGGGKSPAKKKSPAAEKKGVFKVALTVDDKSLASGEAAVGKGPDSRLNLKVKIENLGQVVSESERVLFETTASRREAPLFQRHAILITGNRIPAVAWQDKLEAATNKDLLADVKSRVDEIRESLKAKKATRDTLAKSAELEKEVGSGLGHLINMIFATTSDDQSDRAGAALSVSAWYAVPRVLITSFSSGPKATETTMDLRADRMQAVALPGQAARMNETFLYGRGIIESILEGKVLELLSGKPALTTAVLMQEAARRNIPIRMFSALEKDMLKKFGLPADVLRRTSAALEAGRIVVMPQRSVPWEGRARWGWWDIDPMTREPIGVLDTGLHQAMVQTSILEAEGPLQSDAGLVIGALVGATDTQWMLMSMILEYGQLSKAALLEAKAYMKDIQAVMCPGFEKKIEFSVSVTTVEIEDCFKHEIEIVKGEAGVSIQQGWCEKFAKGFACASTSILNHYLNEIKKEEDKNKGKGQDQGKK
jgi:hypothetical protein